MTKPAVLVAAAAGVLAVVTAATLNRVSDEKVHLVSEYLRSCTAIEQEFGPLGAVSVKPFARKMSTLGDMSQQSFSIVAQYTTEKIDLAVRLEGKKGEWKVGSVVQKSGSRRFEQLLHQCFESGAVGQ